MAKTTKQDEVRPIIIKKIKKGGGGHHGGAWKVAYADFVTAMMAFFLLLWLLNSVTTKSLQTIANYFDPANPKIASNTSGAGGLMGGTTVSPVGAMTSTVQPLTQPQPTGMTSQIEAPKEPSASADNAAQRLQQELKQQEDANFKTAQADLEKAMLQNPELAGLAKNLMIDMTPEGLRIQLVDQTGKPMFPSGSADLLDYTKKLLALVAKVAKTMPNDISIRGHTDNHQFGAGAKYTNWELSADRANASRREFQADGIPEARLANVMGKADREPLNPKDPADPRNRRISIILMRETVQHAAARGAFGDALKPTTQDTDQTPPAAAPEFKPTPGAVYFP